MQTATNTIETIKALFADGTLLVKQEIALAKAEADEKLGNLQTGLIAILAGILIAFVALLVLVQALVAALANLMPPSVAALLVGVVLAIVAFFTVKTGQEHLKPSNLTPEKTMRSVRESASTIAENR